MMNMRYEICDAHRQQNAFKTTECEHVLYKYIIELDW